MDDMSFNCPQYVHFEDGSLQGESDSYFDAIEHTPDVRVQMKPKLKVKSPDLLTESCYDDSLQQGNVENKSPQFQDSLIELNESKENKDIVDEEFRNSISCKEFHGTQRVFRLTPARMKRRGTDTFSSKKKINSRKTICYSADSKISNSPVAVYLTSPGKATRKLAFDVSLPGDLNSNRVSTPLQPRVANEYNVVFEAEMSLIQVELSPVKSATRVSLGLKRKDPFDSEDQDLTQDADLFQIQYNLNVPTEPCSSQDENSKPNVLTGSLKSDSASEETVTKPVSKVRPFHFAEPRKAKTVAVEPYLPLAEQVARFQNKIPERFHTTGNKAFKPNEHWSPHLVVPRSPNLQTRKRIRTTADVVSHQQMEEKEVEAMKQYRFRARPYDPKFIKPQNREKVRRKSLTKPQDVKLQTSERAATQKGYRKEEQKPKYEFHAMPVPKNILKRPVGVKAKRALPATVPASPAFALKDRRKKWEEAAACKVETPPEPRKVFKFSANSKPRSRPKPLPVKLCATAVSPFSFDARDKERFQKKELRIQKEVEKEQERVQFKAKPLPSPLPSRLPNVSKKEITKPVPFNFALGQGSEKRDKFIQQILEEEKEMCGHFKAQPATVLHKDPFLPVKAITHLPVEEFTLYTDIRAAERQQQKEVQEAQKAEMEQERQRQLEEEAEMERFEVSQLRGQMVHKAQPIRQYKSVDIKPAKKVTVPISPEFHTDRRLRERHE